MHNNLVLARVYEALYEGPLTRKSRLYSKKTKTKRFLRKSHTSFAKLAPLCCTEISIEIMQIVPTQPNYFGRTDSCNYWWYLST